MNEDTFFSSSSASSFSSTDKKNSGWPLRWGGVGRRGRGKKDTARIAPLLKRRLIICNNGTAAALREKITGGRWGRGRGE